ncbi:MAG: hypothetical protein H8E26_01690 [FCB group bacterium]|nr:hypothetical protein [FCB group bacterium]MBL7029414.1 hypothetical protein [Candidatus Neomarinimicrobiota bacterium]MBL7123197.1 hypothetical protein [Candidatus Neomarinimicrobiota bacterium]
MEIKRKRWFYIILVIFLFVISCASTTAPDEWLSSAEQTQTQAYGGWIDIELTQTTSREPLTSIRGELIAISTDTVYVLAEALIATPKVKIKHARLTIYDSEAGKLAGWTVLGTFSTISHGFLLILSAPIWIISGSTAAAIQSRKPILDYPKISLDQFKKYARFPQGLPANLNRAKIKPKDIGL